MRDMNEVFSDWVKLQNPKTIKNTTIVTAESLGQDYMLHIDIKTPKVFVPMMPRSAASSEDSTMPRVTVASDLFGCIVGYSRAVYDAHYRKGEKLFKDGYYISKIPFEIALKPNNKLVFDASDSNEVWLVGYDAKHQQYKPTIVGKVFLAEWINTPHTGDKIVVEHVFYIEINNNESVKITNDKVVEGGYWRLSYTTENYTEKYIEESIKIRKIDKKEFEERKSISAATLNISDEKPIYTELENG